MNELYPIFLKAHQLKILIVGGGFVALEKLTFLLKSSPHATVSLVAMEFNPQVVQLIEQYGLKHTVKAYETSDLKDYTIVVGATNDEAVNIQIYHDAKAANTLVNIADNPPYCDFYMGGIVTKGNLKIAISTNGKSPTMAKRLRQFFEEALPDTIDNLLDNLNHYRTFLKGDFEYKVDHLNKLTESLITEKTLYK